MNIELPDNIKIEYLADNMHFAEEIAGWIYNEFIKDIRIGVTFEHVLAGVKGCKKIELPIRFAAKDGDKCAGTIAIVRNDLKCRNYTPWLASLYVGIPYRNNKIGERLVEKIKATAVELGYKELFLRTEHASGYYEKRGWQYVESCVDEYNVYTNVFRFAL